MTPVPRGNDHDVLDAANDPQPGTIWGGGGSTVRVIEVVRDGAIEDVRVELLTGQRGVRKRPLRAVIILRAFTEGTMKPLDLTRDDPWTRLIVERFVNV